MSAYTASGLLSAIPGLGRPAPVTRRLTLATVPLKLTLQPVACLVLPSLLLATGSPQRAAYALFVSVLLLAAIHCLRGKPQTAAVVLLGALPAMMLLRNFFLFTAPIIGLWLVCITWAAFRWSEFSRLFRRGAFLLFILATFAYWWISFVVTSDYATNIRVLELAGACTLAGLLGFHRRYLAAALLAMAVTLVALAVSLLPYSERLGLATIAGDSFGNPVTYGVPAALMFVVALTDGGRWLTLQPSTTRAVVVAGAMGVCLLLSASRGSWLVAFAGVATLLAFGKFGRRLLVWPTVILAFALVILLSSPKGEVIESYFKRATGSERTWNQRTSGRAVQWAALERMTNDIPVWGYGPGSGYLVHERFLGYPKAWHSLYLHLIVETGVVGSGVLLIFLALLVRQGLRRRRLTGDSLSLVAVACYCAVGISVAAMDAGAGVFLGLAFGASDTSGIMILQRLRAVPQ
jgi:O-antigen ligase